MNRITWRLRTLPERAAIAFIAGFLMMSAVAMWNYFTRENYTAVEKAAFVATLRETSAELQKYSEVDDVYFSTIEPKTKLEIRVEVNAPVDKKFFEDETRRIFLHALTDNWNPQEITFSRLIIKVTILPKHS